MPLASRRTPTSFRQITVGSELKRLLQSDQKLVTRSGAAAAQADFDVLKDANPWDLIADGDFDIPEDVGITETPSIGGCAVIAGGITSTDNNTFTLTIKWVDESDNLLYAEQPADFQNVTNLVFATEVKGDRFKLVITDTSGAAQNRIRGSINAHS